MKLWVSVFALTLVVGLSAPAQAAFQLVAEDVFEKLDASAESNADVKKACASSKSSNACKTAKSKALFSIYQSNTNALINTMNEESFTPEEYKRINDIQGAWIKELTGKTYSEVLVLQRDRLSLVINLFNAYERQADEEEKSAAFIALDKANGNLELRAKNRKFYEWLFQYKQTKPSLNTYNVIMKPTYDDFLERNIRDKRALELGMTRRGEKKNFIDHLNMVLGVPDRVVLTKEKTFLISGCRPQSCIEKGLVWIDTKNNRQAFIIRSFRSPTTGDRESGYLIIYSNDFSDEVSLPETFKADLETWTKGNNIFGAAIQFLTN